MSKRDIVHYRKHSILDHYVGRAQIWAWTACCLSRDGGYCTSTDDPSEVECHRCLETLVRLGDAAVGRVIAMDTAASSIVSPGARRQRKPRSQCA